MKRLVSLILVVATLFVLSGCTLEHFTFDRDSDNITRAEWAEELGRNFGMDSCLSASPYFSDVDATNAYFAYVQSGAEWEVFDISEKKFEPDKTATVEFVVETAVNAAELDWRSSTSPLEFAKKKGISCGKADSKASRSFAEEVVEWALNEYQNKEFVEYENIKLKDDLKTVTSIPNEDGTVVVDDGEFFVGDVIITPGNEDNPEGIARKVVSVSTNKNGDTVLETTEPEIGELFDELDFAYIGTVEDTSKIRTIDGVSIVEDTKNTSAGEGHDGLHINNLFHKAENNAVSATPLASKGKSFSFSVKLAKGGKVSFTPQYNSIKAELSKGDNADALKIFEKTGYAQLDDLKIQGDVQTVKGTDKYSLGWEIEGSLAFNDFYVETAIDTKKAFGVPYGIKGYKYEIHYEVSPSVKFSGKLEEELTIATVPIPIGSLGITVDVEIFVKGSVNGDISISAKIANTSTVEYTEKNGYKKTQSTQKESSVELSVNFKVGFGGKATLKALGIKLIDFSIEVGLGFQISGKITKALRIDGGLYKYDGAVAEMSGAKEETLVCLDGTGYFPTISLSIGTSKGTLANKLGLKFTWKIMDKSGATFKSVTIPVHYEFGNGLVEECTLKNLKAYDDKDVEDALATDREETKNDVGREVMDISKYAVSLNVGEEDDLEITALPYGYTGYDLEWRSEDQSIVQIDNVKAAETSFSCMVEAKGAGVTSVTIFTKDGKHMVRCAVIVKDDGTVEFNPLG